MHLKLIQFYDKLSITVHNTYIHKLLFFKATKVILYDFRDEKTGDLCTEALNFHEEINY